MSRLIPILFLLAGELIFCCRAIATNIETVQATAPWVFPGYRSLSRHWLPDVKAEPTVKIWRIVDIQYSKRKQEIADSLARLEISELMSEPIDSEELSIEEMMESIPDYVPTFDADNPIGKAIPDWLQDAIRLRNVQEDFRYGLMVVEPQYIQYTEWDLPVPPRLPEEDRSFLGYLKSLNLPQVNMHDAEVAAAGPEKHINWLHTLNVALQLSQAYISQNWYQGGNDYLAFFGNFLWDVQLNQVFHPNMLFQSTLSYKLAINSTSQDTHHKYSVSQELFQYNFKFGYKARKHWFYTFTTQFKTQFLHNYEANSDRRLAAFLSPGELNLGLGMTYNYEKADKSIVFSASLAPISYNLRTCIDNLVDHSLLNMNPGQKVLNEIGSNAEINFFWALRDNISYKTRLFLFSDYKNFTGDWENTFNFQFSKFFSTQLYLYFRYDTGADPTISPRWGRWMLKEILSVGISYTFATKI